MFVTRAYLEVEIALSQDQISKYADKILLYSNTCMKELRRLFLVQDLIDSLKVCLIFKFHHSLPLAPLTRHVSNLNHAVFQFAVLMWLLTYVGALFNGLTLLILGEMRLFQRTVRSATNVQQALLLSHRRTPAFEL